MVWRPSLGKWYALLSTKAYAPAQARIHHWGASGDKPMVGRMDADAYDELIVWRPSLGKWYVLRSWNGYSAAGALYYVWGAAGDIPM